MAGRGQQATPEQVKAILDAQPHLDGFKGGRNITAPAADFARDAVRDALYAAPQPLTGSWMKSSLAALAGLAQWGHLTGQPMTREHLLSEQVRRRYLFHAANHLESLTQRSYQSRFDVIATALLAPPATPPRNIVGLGLPMLDPTSPREEVQLWMWTLGLRPEMRRRRIQAILALCLGAGARRQDLSHVAARDVSRDEGGVHVHFHTDDTDRTVTCRRDWEDRLWDLVTSVAPERAVAAPKWVTPLTKKTCDSMIDSACAAVPSPVHFTPTTLRSGWLVRHITAGTPLRVLLPAACIEGAASLVKLLGHVPDPTDADRVDALRGA